MSIINHPSVVDLVVRTHRPATAEPMFTWRDLPDWQTHGSIFSSEDVDRAAVAATHVSDELQNAARDGSIGALMCWNATADEEGGHLAVFTGQTAVQLRQTLENVGAWVNTGLVYSEARVGQHWLAADCRIEDSGHVFDVYFISNDRDV